VTKINTAAMSDQKNRTLPYPNGCRRSAGRSECRSAASNSPSVVVSATECAASASMAADPVNNPATAFITAIAALTVNATTTVRVLSPPPEWRFVSSTRPAACACAVFIG
jgi:hypothetical protein